jgi:predicted nucleotidyltransferase
MSAPTIQIEADDLDIIQSLLHKHLPRNSKVWIFGSRAKGTARKYSDIDLAIDLLGAPLPLDLISDLSTDFEESELPFKVDLIDWNAIDPDFRALINTHKIALPFN